MAGIDKNTLLMLHMDGIHGSTSFPDSSLSPIAVVSQSACSISTTTSKFGDGSGALISSAFLEITEKQTEFGNRQRDFTLEFFINFNNLPTLNLASDIFSQVNALTAGNYQLFSYQNFMGSYKWSYTTGASQTFPSTVVGTNEWHHVALVYRSGDPNGIISVYQNGSLQSSNQISAEIGTILSSNPTLGTNSANNWLDAYLDEVRWSTKAIYSGSSFTVPSSPFSRDYPNKYGIQKIRLELRDRNFVLKDILDDEFLNLNWSYSRVGGCGEFSFELPRKRFEEKALSGEFNIRILFKNPDTGEYELWYQGLIESKAPRFRGHSETIPVSGHGYQAQLSRVYLNNLTFTNTEVSAIVAAIVGTYVNGVTDVNYDATLISTTSFTPSSITFNETALSAITKLADLVGEREWGVDKNRDFFFYKRSSSINPNFRFFQGYNMTNFEDNQDFSKIANQIYVQGAQVGGTYHFFGPYNDLSSQAKYGARTHIISNSSVTSSDVGSQFATAYLSEYAEVSRRATCELVNFNAMIESTLPIDLAAEISKKTKYGEKRYGQFLYSGIVSRIINRINYSITQNNSMVISLNLDKPRSSLSESVSQIEYELEQNRQAAL